LGENGFSFLDNRDSFVRLSRRFPAMLGWVIEPIARRLGRKSVETFLREFRDALRKAV
jgi:hypothetical protein